MFFNKKPNKKQVQFIQDVINGKITDIVQIARFVSENDRVDVDDVTYQKFADTIDNIQGIKKYQNVVIEDIDWEKVGDQYEGIFIVVGVGYDNRQDTMVNVKKRKELTINETKFKGKPAIEVLFENNLIGYISSEDVNEILKVKEHIKHIEVDRIYTNSHGDKGLFAKFSINEKALD